MPKKHYIDNNTLLKDLIEYCKQYRKYKKSPETEEKPKVPESVGKAIVDIAHNLSHMPKFNGYTFKDEMIGDAIINCLMYIDNFNPNKSKNPFSYFTQIIYYAFVRRIKAEKKHSYIKHKSFEDFYLNSNLSLEDRKHIKKTVKIDHERVTDLIESVEKTFTKKKKGDILREKEPEGLERFYE